MATLFTTIILRNDTAAKWAAKNPVLAAGELGIENDTGKFKIGNGTTAWNSLGYAETQPDGTTVAATSDGKLGLRNWGHHYYRWDSEKATYELVQVDDSHPWPANLVPCSSDTNSIEWFEFSSENTLAQLANIETTIAGLQKKIGTSTDSAATSTLYGLINSKIGPEGGTITGALVLPDGSEAASKAFVEDQIASADHLKKQVVEVLPEAAAADANTIYLLKTDSGGYRQYVLINGEMVPMGGNSDDLSDYATRKSLEDHTTNTTIHITAQERSDWNKAKEIIDAMPAIKDVGEGLSLNENGVLGIDQVNVQKLFVASEDTFVLNGGSAAN